MSNAKRKVTIIYCCDNDLAMYRKTQVFNLNAYGDMIIPQNFKRGKTIVAVCDGEVNIINSLGDRVVQQHWH